MSRWTSEWEDGTLTITYDGNGSGTATFSASPNEGVDRTKSVTLVDEDSRLSFKVSVTQAGMREVLECTDGALMDTQGEELQSLKL